MIAATRLVASASQITSPASPFSLPPTFPRGSLALRRVPTDNRFCAEDLDQHKGEKTRWR